MRAGRGERKCVSLWLGRAGRQSAIAKAGANREEAVRLAEEILEFVGAQL